MKRLFILVSFVCIGSQVTYSQKNDAYVFLIKPKSDEWKQLTIFERKASLQIPDDVLANISTEGLLETCLDFPYLFEIWFHGSNYQNGFEEELLSGR